MSEPSNSNANKGHLATTGLFVGLQPFVATASVVLMLAFVAFACFDVVGAENAFGAARDWIAQTLSGYYVAVATLMMFLAFWLMFSR